MQTCQLEMYTTWFMAYLSVAIIIKCIRLYKVFFAEPERTEIQKNV